MALKDDRSCHCLMEELDLFAVKPTQISVEDSYSVEYLPISTLTDSGTIEFDLAGTSDYLDLSSVQLYCCARVVNADGTELAEDAVVAPVNYWLHSLWSQVDVSFNNKMITASNNTYPYRAYLEALLNFGSDAKKTHLTSALWKKDVAEQYDTLTNANQGFRDRKFLARNSRIVEMLGKIHFDMGFQPRYLIDGVDVKVRLSRSKDTFSLMSANNGEFKVNLKSVALFARKIRPSPPVLMGHLKALERGTVKYPISRVDVKVFSIPSGDLTVVKNIISGQIPKRVIIGLVDNAAFNGQLDKNPFYFKNYNLNFLALYQDGKQIPSKAYQPNFSRQNTARSYFALFLATGNFFRNGGHNLSKSEFIDGCTLYAFDLTPNSCDSSHTDLIRHGTIRLECKFGTALPNSVNIVVFTEFDSLLEIDRSRSVSFDFNS